MTWHACIACALEMRSSNGRERPLLISNTPAITAGRGGGGGVGEGVLPYKVLMLTSCQPGYVFRDFGLNQGIDVIIFCLKQPARMFYELNYCKIFTRSF